MLCLKHCLLLVAFATILHGTNAVELHCVNNYSINCVVAQNVTLRENDQIHFKILPDRTVWKLTLKGPLKTKFIPTTIFDQFPDIYWLQLKNVGLERISSDDFVNTNLTIVTIEGNNLGTLKKNTFSTLKKLTELIISENAITTIEEGAFNGLDELERIELNGNKMVNLDITQFTKFPKLRALIAHQMEFAFPPYNADEVAQLVRRNSSVKFFILSHNHHNANPDLLRQLSIFPNLETVDLSNTSLVQFDHKLLHELFPRLTLVYLSENPLDKEWFKEADDYLSKKGVTLQDT